MSRNGFRLVIVLAAISLVGVILIQMFWVRKAFDLREKQFNHSMNIALKSVVDDINRCNNTPLSTINPIEQLSTNYYTVNVNSFIDPYQLEEFLRKEFKKREIAKDFEYGIYDCSNEKMVYGDYVSLESGFSKNKQTTQFPKLDNNNYYFGVYLPTKDTNLLSQMGIWTFSSLVLVLVVVFFAYTLFIILKQRRLSEVQKEFINNMTHEFKTPIATIAISAKVLQNPDIGKFPERLQNYASIIADETGRLQHQVDRVLQMATLNKEKLKLEFEDVDLHQLINQTINGVTLALKDGGGNIQVKLNADNAILKLDKMHFTNILHNLLDNAIKYCKSVPDIVVSTTNDGKKIILKITDKGIGISQDHIKRIFNRFFRVPTGNIHDVKGFGLGLNYVKEMVEAHKGKITVESQLGQGTSFIITLPTFNDR